jgi:pyrroline-5-carboxylate reductase
MPNNLIGFIGGGNMSTSLVVGLIESGWDPDKIIVSDPNIEKRDKLVEQLKITAINDNKQLASKVDVIILGIKPNNVKEVLTSIQNEIKEKQPLILSVAAGITTKQISTWVNNQSYPIVRAMPNTPALIRQGATGVFANSYTNNAYKKLTTKILEAVSCIAWIQEESQIDIVTALSGSGPAFFFYFIETLIQSAKKLGLDEQSAHKLCLQTAIGSALLAKDASSLKELRERVTSKGGTTQAGLNCLMSESFQNIIENTIKSASLRGKEISKQYD